MNSLYPPAGCDLASRLTYGVIMENWYKGFFYEPAEYARPWKLFSLWCGIALLVCGSYIMPAPDWDVPISLLMAIITYITAPCSMRVLLERRWRLAPIALFFTWFAVDGIYSIYWILVDKQAWEFMRWGNAPASLSLYLICGLIWYPKCSLREHLTTIYCVLFRKNH